MGVSSDRISSGTSWIPASHPFASHEYIISQWKLRAQGNAFAMVDAQSGPRGGTQAGALGWAGITAMRGVLGGRMQLRSVFSIDALGVGNRGNPLLLQSGAATDGFSSHDHQQPRELITELAASWERALSATLAAEAYAAVAGEPALGPVTWTQRPSAAHNPASPLGTHLQDEAQTAYGVLTLGLFGPRWKMEASRFNGRMPDDQHLTVDRMRLDSYSARLTLYPDDAWSMSFGLGYIHEPDPQDPEVAENRFTAALMNARSIGADGVVNTTFIYGANKPVADPGWSHSALLESDATFGRNTLIGRVERVHKNPDALALGEGSDPSSFIGPARIPVYAFTLGYARSIAHVNGFTLDIGATGTLNLLTSSLEGDYGSRTPMGTFLFVRVKVE